MRSTSLQVAVVLLGCGCAFLGGYLNRLRGGYLQQPAAEHNSALYWWEHFASRLVFAVPVGVFAGFFSGRSRHGFLAVSIFTLLTLFVGWGSYFGIGHGNDAAARSGVFDWLVGRADAGDSFARRWLRDYSAMALRGIVWTLPSGVFLMFEGFGWHYAFSGVAMPLVYDICHRTVTSSISDFLDGPTAVAEFAWGIFIVTVLLSAPVVRFLHIVELKNAERFADGGREAQRELSLSAVYRAVRSPIALQPVPGSLRAAPTVLTLIFKIMFTVTMVWYLNVKQKDYANFLQSLGGMAFASTSLVVAVVWVWRRDRKAALRSSGTEQAPAAVPAESHFRSIHGDDDDQHDTEAASGLHEGANEAASGTGEAARTPPGRELLTPTADTPLLGSGRGRAKPPYKFTVAFWGTEELWLAPKPARAWMWFLSAVEGILLVLTAVLLVGAVVQGAHRPRFANDPSVCSGLATSCAACVSPSAYLCGWCEQGGTTSCLWGSSSGPSGAATPCDTWLWERADC